MHCLIKLNDLKILFCPKADSLYLSFKISIIYEAFLSSSIKYSTEFINIEIGLCRKALNFVLFFRLTFIKINSISFAILKNLRFI